MCTCRRLAGLLLLLCLPAADARAQVSVSGEVTATIGSHDEIAFFNYTDYEHNALRMFRVSLSGMWRPDDRVAFLAELRKTSGPPRASWNGITRRKRKDFSSPTLKPAAAYCSPFRRGAFRRSCAS